MERGCFPLRKYLSNHPDILAGVPPEFLEVNAKALQDEFAILGVSWNPSNDMFSFDTIQFKPESKLTRRVILSRTAKLFDPLGWLAPVVIQAKILMQLVWQEKKGWDDEVSPEIAKIWNKWNLNSVRSKN